MQTEHTSTHTHLLSRSKSAVRANINYNTWMYVRRICFCVMHTLVYTPKICWKRGRVRSRPRAQSGMQIANKSLRMWIRLGGGVVTHARWLEHARIWTLSLYLPIRASTDTHTHVLWMKCEMIACVARHWRMRTKLDADYKTYRHTKPETSSTALFYIRAAV